MAGNWEIIIPEAATNIITNPSAETNATGYSAYLGGESVTKSALQATRGAASIRCQTTSSTSVEGVLIRNGTSLFEVSASTDYTLSFDIIAGAIVSMKAILSWYTAASAFISNSTLTFNSAVSWENQVLTAESPATAAKVQILIIETTGTATLLAFYIDAVNLVESDHVTTHIDGDQPGCKWNGTPHGSTSTRDQFEARGGRVYNLGDNLGFIVSAQDGTGMPPVSNLSSPLALQPGSLFDGQTIQSRNFSLTGSIIGSSVANFHSQKQALIKALNVNTTTIGTRGQPRTFRYTGSAVEKEIHAAYDGGLEFGLPIGWTEKEFTLRLLADDPFFYGIGDSAAVLDTNDTATFSYIAGRIDGAWSALGPPSSGGAVLATLKVDNTLYIGGAFTNWNGNANADYIVSYDLLTGTYSALGTGMNGNVSALLKDSSGNIYAGGAFTTAGGTTVRGVAVWNGSAWAALGPPSSGGTVLGMAFDSSENLYVVGDFTNWNGIANADYIAKWSGSAWAALGTGFNDVARGIGVDTGNNIYVSGDFTTAVGTAVADVAKWNGSAWAAMGTGFNGTANRKIIVSDGGDVYASGVPAGDTGVGVSKWNGSSWSRIATTTGGTDANVYSINIGDDGFLYAAGGFLIVDGITMPDGIAKWNGSTWSPIDIDLPGSATTYSVTQTDGGLFVGFSTTGTATFSGSTTIAYSGTERAYPIIKIKRSGGTSAVIHTIRQETTVASLTFAYSLLNGEELVLDTRPGNQSITSSIRGNVYSELQTSSDFGNFYLMPGNGSGSQNNIITAFVGTVGSPTITAVMVYRNVYISED